jgi:hypothetical protein
MPVGEVAIMVTTSDSSDFDSFLSMPASLPAAHEQGGSRMFSSVLCVCVYSKVSVDQLRMSNPTPSHRLQR